MDVLKRLQNDMNPAISHRPLKHPLFLPSRFYLLRQLHQYLRPRQSHLKIPSPQSRYQMHRNSLAASWVSSSDLSRLQMLP
jgi:hypothetical protein